jgi:DNA-binding transcriptional LysR family regulator
MQESGNSPKAGASSMNKTWNISTQQIQIFLKAVEVKNFTKVANHFNFTPSMVSKTITALENELDLQLFIRKPHELTPTPAGNFLATEWRPTIAALGDSILKAQTFQNEERHTFVLGFVDSSTVVDALIRRSILSYTDTHPEITLTAEKHDMHRAVELLNTGMLDIALTSEIEVSYLEDHHLPWEKVCTTSVAVFVPRGNPLFDRASLTFDDLREQAFYSLNPMMHPCYAAWLNDLCGRHGFIPRIAATFRTVRSLMFNLKLNEHLFVGDSITSDWCDDDLKMFILPEKSFTLVAWRRDDIKALVDLKDYLKTVYPPEY